VKGDKMNQEFYEAIIDLKGSWEIQELKNELKRLDLTDCRNKLRYLEAIERDKDFDFLERDFTILVTKRECITEDKLHWKEKNIAELYCANDIVGEKVIINIHYIKWLGDVYHYHFDGGDMNNVDFDVVNGIVIYDDDVYIDWKFEGYDMNTTTEDGAVYPKIRFIK